MIVLYAQGSGLLENCLACLFCMCIYITTILRLLDLQAEVAVSAMAAIIGWGYMLFFVMAFRLTGPFVVMIYKMLFNDVLRFFIIYAVFLAGFSQAFFILFDNNGTAERSSCSLARFLFSRLQWFHGQRQAELSGHAGRLRSRCLHGHHLLLRERHPAHLLHRCGHHTAAQFAHCHDGRYLRQYHRRCNTDLVR